MMRSRALPLVQARESRRRFEMADAILPAFILALVLGVSAVEPKFISGSNIANLASQLAPLMILAVGQAYTIINGGLDLSMSSIMSLAGVAGVLAMPVIGVEGGVALMAVIGLGTGLISGAIIAYLRTSPLIVTLGMASVAQALALILANGVPIYDIPPELTERIGFASIAGVPVNAVIAAAVLLLGAVILRRTVLGRYIYAIGSNRSAALKSGVDVAFYTMLVYGFSGLVAGVAGLVLTAWIGAAQPTAEPGLTLQAIAAVVLGGVALTGGSGGMLHVFYGVLILGMLSNAMNMLGISAYYQILAVGVVIIVAVVLDRLRRGEQ
ncbi:ABC transporter permease [Azospirillum sp. ST 5-10]|uniref:ABC transporter permease n=1 Tax=unclassified Azospirillum TaxID=2630922 RepID=UPI003F49D800